MKKNTEEKTFKYQHVMPDNCPPKDASVRNIEPVYRFIMGDKIQEQDFLNHLETNRPYYDRCGATALSFYTSLEAMEATRKKYKRFRKNKILKGKIEQEFGKSNIRGTHINLWLYEDVVLFEKFKGKVLESDN